MRIAINAQLISAQNTGIGVASAALLDGLARIPIHRDELHVFVPQSAPLPFDEPPAGFTVHRSRVSPRARLLRILYEQSALPRALRRIKADLLHATAYVAPLRSPCPVVLTLHDVIALVHPEYCSRANALYFRRMIPRSVEAATHVIASSEHTKRDIIDALGCRDAKITVIPLPVLDLFRPVDDPSQLARVRAKYRLPERFILFVGQLDPKKNIPTILRVFDALRKRGRPEKLVIAGKRGWREREVFRTLDELRLADDVVRTGYVELADLPAVYALARVLYFPSLDEGFGLPPLEAMACGTPVLASNAGGLPESAGDAAVLVDPLDAEKHVEELTKLLDDEALRAKMKSLGLARVRAFRVEDFARRHLELYHRLAGETSPT